MPDITNQWELTLGSVKLLFEKRYLGTTLWDFVERHGVLSTITDRLKFLIGSEQIECKLLSANSQGREIMRWIKGVTKLLLYKNQEMK